MSTDYVTPAHTQLLPGEVSDPPLALAEDGYLADENFEWSDMTLPEAKPVDGGTTSGQQQKASAEGGDPGEPASTVSNPICSSADDSAADAAGGAGAAETAGGQPGGEEARCQTREGSSAAAAEDDEDEVDVDAEEEDDDDDEDEDSDESYEPTWNPGNRKDSDDEQDSDRPWMVDQPLQRLHACIHKREAESLRQLVSSKPVLLQESDRLGRSPLHLALLRGEPDMVEALLATDDSFAVAQAVRTPFRGAGAAASDALPVLHLALATAPLERTAKDALRCLELLLSQEQLDLNVVDGRGRTVLHLACLQGSAHVLDALLQRRADPGARDEQGQLPLHYAIDSRNQECVQRLLAASDPRLFEGGLHPFYRCIDRQAWSAAFLVYRQGWPIPEAEINRLFDFAAARGLAREWNFVSEKGVEGSCSLEELQWPSELFGPAATALITHPVCLNHGVLPLDVDDPSLRHRLMRQTPENPHRLEVLCGERGILRSEAFRDLRWISEPMPAPLTDVLRVHEDWYVHGLLQRVREVTALGPLHRLALDSGDTKVTPESWTAALRACGCVLEAVELVCNEQVRNAFCAVRPPGHHLGPGGACNTADLEDDPEGSQGFCLLNNVAVGAAYVRCVYRHIIRRVAIVDFDVHHGNGTEAAVRRVKWRHNEVPVTREVMVRGVRAKIVAESPASCKPWLDPESDAENLFFASVHGYGSGFYPGTGASCNETSPRIVNAALGPGAGSSEFRAGLRERVIPELLAFDPDILFLSAGFDGHEQDLIGCCRCLEEDYIWVTKQMMSIANRCCQGRLISVLEGGYNTRAELLSPFAQSVAGHIQTLMHTSPNYCFLECEGQVAEERNGETAREVAATRKRKLPETQELEDEESAKRLVFGSDDESGQPTGVGMAVEDAHLHDEAAKGPPEVDSNDRTAPKSADTAAELALHEVVDTT